MHFLGNKKPVDYLKETHEYIDDLQRITLLRNRAADEAERENYDKVIRVMQEVLVFMNTLAPKDNSRL